MIKICKACGSTWAGGQRCEDCGQPLSDPFAPEAATELPRGVWRYIRLQYGARRGMIVRVLAFLLAPAVFALVARAAAGWPGAWSRLGLAAAIAAALATWWTIYWAAGKAVRVFVLRRGQLSKRRAAKALLRKLVKPR